MNHDKKLLAVFLALSCLPLISFGQFAGKITLGHSFPTGPSHVRDCYNGSFLYGVGFEYMFHPRTSIGLDVSHNPWKAVDDYYYGGEYNWTPVLLYIRYKLTVGTAFYLRPGIGLYHTHYRYEYRQYDYWHGGWVTIRESGDADDFGIHVGFGGEFYTNGIIAPYLEARFNNVFRHVEKDITFIDLTAGIIVHFSYWY